MVADSAAMIRLMPAELIEAIEANNGAALDTRVIIPLRAELLGSRNQLCRDRRRSGSARSRGFEESDPDTCSQAVVKGRCYTSDSTDADPEA
jgi:hypothetical protein